MTELATTPPHADSALAVYLEPHARDARVLLFDSAGGAVGERLARVTPDIAYGAPSKGRGSERLPYPDRSFDLVVVAEADGPEAPPAVDELVRVLVRGGLLVLAQRDQPRRARRPERGAAPSLDDQLAKRFKNVRVLTQTQLAGFALVDLARADQAELSIDSRLVRGSRPSAVRRVLVASDAGLPEEGRLWVEVPPSAPDAPSVDPRVYESLRRAEDDARDALRREGELLRELEHLRRAEEHALALEKRARSFEQKLLAAEADYDDAVGKVRYFEAQVSERDRALTKERALREERERELSKSEASLAKFDDKLGRAADDAKAARADAQAARAELAEAEERLTQTSTALRSAQADQKRAEIVARDLVEELRRFEQGALERAEHDALVEELTAERDRAVQRALDAEVARESAQLRADELRAELLASASAQRHEADTDNLDALNAALQASEQGRDDAETQLDEARAALTDAQSALAAAGERLLELDRALADRERGLAELQGSALRSEALALQVDTLQAELLAVARREREGAPSSAVTSTPAIASPSIAVATLEGECTGLAMRLNEAESALRSAMARAREAGRRARELELSADDAKRRSAVREDELADRVAALESELRSREASPARGASNAADADLDALRDALARAEQRADDLTRELDEADRIAAVHAEDDDRLETLEGELEAARRHMDELDDDVRSRDEEMRVLREQSSERLAHADARADDAQRREAEARAERDAAHGALAEARAILAQLSTRVGADASDPSALLEALDRKSVEPALVDGLRTALDEAQRDRREAIERADDLERRVRELESRVQPENPWGQS